MSATRGPRAASPVRAVFFDVDFTLIYPGPTFQGVGYVDFGARHGLALDESRFPAAVAAASSLLDEHQEHAYDDEIFIRYTGRIIEEMGGAGPAVVPCAAEVYREWAACHHFFLYDDVAATLRTLAAQGMTIGLISNSHRSMESFQEHFELQGLIAAGVSSAEHGRLKPHPSIFEDALAKAGVSAGESVMVGDSVPHDIEGARRAGMRGVLVHRSSDPLPVLPDVPVIRSLADLPALLPGL
jgi:HAD superfamily hydrolase (TIGR01662 family)